MLISLIIVIVFILSFFGGLKEGAVKNFFGLLGLLIAIPLSGLYYKLMAGFLSFLPGDNWENFFGFYIVLTILVVIFTLIFMVPRRIIRTIWGKGLLYRLIGGVIGVFYGAVAITLFALVTFTYPVFDFLARWLAGSGVIEWLVDTFSFVQSMLPEVFEKSVSSFTSLISFQL